MDKKRILLIGTGDLGSKIAFELLQEPEISDVVVTSRNPQVGRSIQRILSTCGNTRVGYATLDALDEDALKVVIQREQPDIIVQTASLMSPWRSREIDTSVTRALREGGFSLEISAHLPIVLALMRAVKAIGYEKPVVNASFPDLTHPILAKLGLSPMVGIGNVGMIHRTIQSDAAFQRGGRPTIVRTIAHHSQVSAVMRSDPKLLRGAPNPRIFADEMEVDGTPYLFSSPPIIGTKDLNIISAVHARDVVTSLFPGTLPRRGCVPGVMGRPGGWPVIFQGGHVEVDLPIGLSEREVTRFQVLSAKADGIEDIGDDGTLYYTQSARDSVRLVCPELAEPLSPNDVHLRWKLLSTLCGIGTLS